MLINFDRPTAVGNVYSNMLLLTERLPTVKGIFPNTNVRYTIYAAALNGAR